MSRMTISLTKEQIKTLKDISNKEHRPYSNQIVHMMEFYIKHKDKVKQMDERRERYTEEDWNKFREIMKELNELPEEWKEGVEHLQKVKEELGKIKEEIKRIKEEMEKTKGRL